MNNLNNYRYGPHRSSLGMDANVLAMLIYLLTGVLNLFLGDLSYFLFLIPLVIAFLEKESDLVRFHAIQCTLLNLFNMAIMFILGLLAQMMLTASVSALSLSGVGSSVLIIGGLGIVFGIFVLVVSVMQLFKAYAYQISYIPLLGPIAEKLMNKLKANQNNQTPPQGGYNQTPPPQGGYNQAPPAQGGYNQTPPAQGGFNQAPPAQGGFNQAPPAQGGFNQAPPAQGGFNQAPPAQGGFNQAPPAQGGFNQAPPAQGGFNQAPPAQGGFAAPNTDPNAGYNPNMGAYTPPAAPTQAAPAAPAAPTAPAAPAAPAAPTAPAADESMVEDVL